MTDIRPEHDQRIDTVDCPVFGGLVTIRATYSYVDPRAPFLTDFACSGDVRCGIPDWDPCPLYIRYLEGNHSKPPAGPAVD